MNINSLLEEFGEVNGLLIFGILFLFWIAWKLLQRIFKQHTDQLNSKQHEIDRLAEENHRLAEENRTYRKFFFEMLGKQFPDEAKR